MHSTSGILFTGCRRASLPEPGWNPRILQAAILPLHAWKMMPQTDQGGLIQWESGSVTPGQLIGCSSLRRAWSKPAALGLEEVPVHDELGCFKITGLWVLILFRSTQTDLQWLQINPYPVSHMILACGHLSLHNGCAWIWGQNVSPFWWHQEGCSCVWLQLLSGAVQKVSRESRR